MEATRSDQRQRPIGELVREYRRAAGLSQQQLADAMTEQGRPWRKQTVYTVESGQRNLRIPEALTLQRIIGLPASTVQFDEDSERETRVQLEAASLAAEMARIDATIERMITDLGGLLAEVRTYRHLYADEPADQTDLVAALRQAVEASVSRKPTRSTRASKEK